MRFKLKTHSTVSALSALAILLSGCGGAAKSPDAGTGSTAPSATKEIAPVAKIDNKPVTLSMFLNQSLSDDEFQRIVVDPVKKKYPNITINLIRSGGNNTLNNMLTTGQQLDLIYYSPNLYPLHDLDLPVDLRELMKKVPVDLNQFDKAVIDQIRTMGKKGEIFALPFVKNMTALYYNKDLFDKFGVGYPKDGLFWDETLDLARKVSRTEGGVQYRGLDPYMLGNILRISTPYSLDYVNAATNKAIVDEKWKQIFQLGMDFYNIPSNRPAKLARPDDDFVKTQVMAMYPVYVTTMMAAISAVPTLNYDIAQYPSFRDKPNLSYQVDYHTLIISKTSKYPEQAMQVLQAMTSLENQKVVSRIGRNSVIDNKEVEKEFGAESPILKGKNVAAIFKSKSAPGSNIHKYDSLVSGQINSAFTEVFNGTSDINTALRNAEEKANQAIAEAIAKETAK
ncbi:MAG: transporter substrate-binding protein [Paenibacillus sp.]|jgi:multiple sugar transport system substrate-binding protein|nr:transporter substrate-binding protein [Paenibacillus sp.]